MRTGSSHDGWTHGSSTSPLRLHDAQHVLAAQPFSLLVGARITEFTPGSATIELDIRSQHQQQFGLVHGGVLAYLVDNALTFAAGSVLGPSIVSSGYSVDLVGNAREGVLRAAAQVLHVAASRAVCAVEVVAVGLDGSSTVCAVAQGSAVGTRVGDHPSRS